MAKREVFDHSVGGPVMRSMHHISVDRADGGASLDEALRYLQAGEVVGIFPEATISRSFEVKELKTGATRIAAQAGVPLVPVVLWGTQRMMTKDHPARLLPRQDDRDPGRRAAADHRRGADPAKDTLELHDRLRGLLDRVDRRAYPAAGAAAGVVVAAGLARRFGARPRSARPSWTTRRRPRARRAPGRPAEPS